MKTILTAFLMLFSFLTFAQNINGIWSGTVYAQDKKGKDIFRFAIGIDISYDSVSNKVKDFSRTLSFDTVIAECKIKGKYNKKKEFFDIRETETISTNIPMDKPSSVLNRFKIKFEKTNQSEIITGKCFCTKDPIDYLCWQRMKIELKRYTPPKIDDDIKKE
jgi:hypothetical protein